jgi:Sulfotransferase family
MFTSGHVQELAEVKALTYELNESTQVVLERITEARRQLVPRGPLLAFVHIPKTAGGTAKTMLQRAYSKPALHSAGNYVRGPEKTVKKVAKPAGGWERWHEKGGRVTIGHVPYGVFRDHLPAGTRYMTFLREPVDRVLSHYYRHVHHPELSAAHRMGRRQRGRETAGSIEEALSDLHVPQLRNLATRFLCGHPSPMGELSASAVDDAKENLREFAFVGIQERFDESMVLLQRMLGLGLIPYLNVHVSLEGRRPTAEEISDEQRALIEEHNTLDAELYRFGLELFEEAVAAREDGFAADVEALPALSAKANEEAFQRARDWLDRELPVGSAREPGELRSAAKAAGITVPALKRALSVSSVRKRDQAGHRVWTRVDGTRGVAESSGRSYV